MKTAILYIRVSTDEQAQKGYSQRYQEEVLLKYCQFNYLEVQEIIFEDHSAKTFNRPAWKAMITGFKRKNAQRPDYLLFIKRDRFSRNAADAYQMLRLLNEYNIDAQATEQPLDLSVPENKIMLAFYLAAPEVENDRRALNVIHGMRRARKEGRWMRLAPLGYINRSTENGDKYICPAEPQAGLMRWVFTEIAAGMRTTEQIWKEGKKKGLACGRSNFRTLIRNPVYCGKVIIPQYKDEDGHWVSDQHEVLITETIFIQAQKMLDLRKRGLIKKQRVIPSELVLRGFLICPACGRALTGSLSKGRHAYYYYYHCQAPCKFRIKAELANDILLHELIKWRADNKFIPLFKAVMNERHQLKMKVVNSQRENILIQIEQQQNRYKRACQLFLSGDMNTVDFEHIKSDQKIKCENWLGVLESLPVSGDRCNQDFNNKGTCLLKLHNVYKLASTQNKRKLIGMVFPSSIVIIGAVVEPCQYGLATKSIYFS
jgi:DNA invertase Pin-like site-specific DNA recombinase